MITPISPVRARSVRHSAIAALSGIGGQPAIDALLVALNSPALDARKEIIQAFGTMKAKSAVPRLLAIASQPETHDEIITALTQIGDLAAFEVYMDGLGSKNSSVRVQCENALRGLHAQALPLIEAKLATNDLPAPALASLKQLYGGDPEAKKNAAFRHKVLEVAPGQYQEFALSHPGEARRGSKLFHDLKGLGCIRCHKINGEGGDIGPDLTSIRTKYARADIVESVLYPSKQILDGYQQVFFETKDDDEISGIVRGETPVELTVIDSAGIKHVLDKSKITSRKTSKISLMPEGLQDGLSLVEFSDLIAYVENPNVPTAPLPGAGLAGPHPRPLKGPNPIVTASQSVPPPPDVTGEDLFSPFSPSALTAPPPAPTPPMPVPSPSKQHPESSGPHIPVASGEYLAMPPSGPLLPPAPQLPQSTN